MDNDAQLAQLADAPMWGNLIGAVGKYSIILALVGFILAILFSIKEGQDKLRRLSFGTACVSVVVAFATLLTLFITKQYQFKYVAEHSESINPLIYKISALWTGQQGSFLLWAFWSAICAGLTFRRAQSIERGYTAVWAIILGILTAILTRETPFEVIKEAITTKGIVKMPFDGNGMVPSLQNYWNNIHPPVVFLGFASLAIPFCHSLAGVLHRDTTEWVKITRGPVIFGMTVLGVGISLGGLWAYETLNWGGFWGWDPVENVSLVPWIFLVALSHGIIMQTTRKKWISTNVFLGGLPFIAFVYGTFLTRSGLLDKVSNHSFAQMERGALQILRGGMIGLFIAFVVAYIITLRRQPKADNAEPVRGVNRETFYQMGMLSLCLLASVIALGMSWPVITALRGGEGARVEEAVYHRALIWFFVPIMIAIAVGPIASWKREQIKSLTSRLVVLLSVSLGLVGALLIIFKNEKFGVRITPGATLHTPIQGFDIPLVLGMAGIMFLAIFPAITNLWRAIELSKRSKLGTGPFISHFGICLLLGGLLISRGFEREADITVTTQTPGEGIGYKIAFKEYDWDKRTDRENRVKFTVTSPEGNEFEIAPTLFYHQMGGPESPEQAQVWPYIVQSFSHDLNFAMGEPVVEFFKPAMNLKEGETKTQSSVTIKNIKSTNNGKFGQAGAEFGALLEISYEDRGELKKFNVNPTLKIVDGGLQPSLHPAGDFQVALESMSPKDKSVNVQLYVNPPFFPIKLFYKPLTSLVWIGTGIFLIGGLMSAANRRLRKTPAIIEPEDSNAPVPATEG